MDDVWQELRTYSIRNISYDKGAHDWLALSSDLRKRHCAYSDLVYLQSLQWSRCRFTKWEVGKDLVTGQEYLVTLIDAQ